MVTSYMVTSYMVTSYMVTSYTDCESVTFPDHVLLCLEASCYQVTASCYIEQKRGPMK